MVQGHLFNKHLLKAYWCLAPLKYDHNPFHSSFTKKIVEFSGPYICLFGQLQIGMGLCFFKKKKAPLKYPYSRLAGKLMAKNLHFYLFGKEKSKKLNKLKKQKKQTCLEIIVVSAFASKEPDAIELLHLRALHYLLHKLCLTFCMLLFFINVTFALSSKSIFNGMSTSLFFVFIAFLPPFHFVSCSVQLQTVSSQNQSLVWEVLLSVYCFD